MSEWSLYARSMFKETFFISQVELFFPRIYPSPSFSYQLAPLRIVTIISLEVSEAFKI